MRVLSKKEHPKRFKEKIFSSYFNIKRNYNSKLLWFHAASIGEFKSIIPIIKRLNELEKGLEFLITTTTLSSGYFAETELKKIDNATHRFLPLDINFLIRTFIELWKPKKIFLVDSEIWPNLLLNAKKKNIPIALINARLTKKSFKRWSSFSNVAKKIFNIFDLCICANKETKMFLEKLNAKNIKYVGNLKFINHFKDRDFENKNTSTLSQLRFWVAASTHAEEDIICLKTHIAIKKKFNDIITIIAPRHLNRVKKIKSLSENHGLKTQILNHNDKIVDNAEIIIINSFGVLQNYFLHAKSVFIGKSMVESLKNDSGQNPIDAAYLNCKIYHGPYTSNFLEIYDVLSQNNIAKKIINFDDLSNYLISDLENFKKKDSSCSNSLQIFGQNISDNTIKLITNFLHDKTN